MKIFYTIILATAFLWTSPLYAEYCKYSDTGKVRSCEFKVTGLKKRSQIVISYTQQGWSLMAVIFLKEFVFVEGDARIEVGKNEPRTLEYVQTRRDVTGGQMMEAGVFKISEDLLHEIANADGGIRIYLSALESEERRIKANDSRFSGLDDYIVETKAALNLD